MKTRKFFLCVQNRNIIQHQLIKFFSNQVCSAQVGVAAIVRKNLTGKIQHLFTKTSLKTLVEI